MTGRRRHPTAAMAVGVPYLAGWFLLAQWALGAGTALVILAAVLAVFCAPLAAVSLVRLCYGKRIAAWARPFLVIRTTRQESRP